MGIFRDNQSREWQVALDATAIARIHDGTGLDFKTKPRAAMQSIGRKPVLLIEVLYAACEPQILVAGMSGPEFGAALAGVIEPAAQALIDAVAAAGTHLDFEK